MTPRPGPMDVLRDGLWRQNTGLVVLLGLCPLLAISNTVVNALGLGLATLMVLTLSNTAVSALRGLLGQEIRIPAYVLIIASLVTAVELVMQAFFHDLFRALGIFIPLIVTNCMIIGRAEAFASRQPVPLAALDGLATGAGFLLTLLALGAVREVVGRGTLLADAELLLGRFGAFLELDLVPGDGGFLLAMLPPGAFIALGLLVAARNAWTRRQAARAAMAPAGVPSDVTEAA